MRSVRSIERLADAARCDRCVAHGAREQASGDHKALMQAKDDGFEIVEIHSGHVWGKVVAPNGQQLTVYGTPRNPEEMAKRIREFARKYAKEGG